MKRSRVLWVVGALGLGLFAAETSFGVIFPSKTGNWPKDWPAELEPLRKSSRTLDCATGTQEHIYTIPIPDKKTFDAIWPALLKVRTPGSPLTLYRTGEELSAGWGTLLSNERAAVRIYAPAWNLGGFKKKAAPAADAPPPAKADPELSTSIDWPEELRGDRGELPEYVTTDKPGNGKTLIAVDPAQDGHKGGGFFRFRARVDIELVVDGQAIDLNNVQFPGDARIIDRRFGK